MFLHIFALELGEKCQIRDDRKGQTDDICGHRNVRKNLIHRVETFSVPGQIWKETQSMLAAIKRFAAHESGATAIEYGLIAALVAVGLIAALTALGSSLQTIFNTISTQLNSASS